MLKTANKGISASFRVCTAPESWLKHTTIDPESTSPYHALHLKLWKCSVRWVPNSNLWKYSITLAPNSNFPLFLSFIWSPPFYADRFSLQRFDSMFYFQPQKLLLQNSEICNQSLKTCLLVCGLPFEVNLSSACKCSSFSRANTQVSTGG